MFSIDKDPHSWLYPEIEPYQSGFLDVSDGHSVYYEQSGNPLGKPAIFIHGGPGGGTNPKQRRFFDPNRYRIILFDQRGCGKSTPHASLENNTTPKLIADIEKLREKLQIKKWQVFGGSWGSTLALAYAIQFSQAVTELVLRGIFLVRPVDLSWFYQFGASEIKPEAWESYRDFIPENERDDFVKAYYKRLTSSDKAVQAEAAKRWSVWEGMTSELNVDEVAARASFSADLFALAFARIECHYFMNDCFMPSPNYLIANISKLAKIPMTIVHGQYDIVCPLSGAWELKKALPQAELFITPNAGHSAFELPNSRALVAATDKYSSV